MAESSLEPEHVADFHEKLPAVVQVALGRVGDVSRRRRGLRDYVEVIRRVRSVVEGRDRPFEADSVRAAKVASEWPGTRR